MAVSASRQELIQAHQQLLIAFRVRPPMSGVLRSPSSAGPHADTVARDRRQNQCALLRRRVDDRRLVDKCPHGKSETRPKGAAEDRSARAVLASRVRAGGHCASGRTRAGTDEHSHTR